MTKQNNLDQLPLAELGEKELKEIKELEKNISSKLNSEIYLMALEGQESK